MSSGRRCTEVITFTFHYEVSESPKVHARGPVSSFSSCTACSTGFRVLSVQGGVVRGVLTLWRTRSAVRVVSMAQSLGPDHWHFPHLHELHDPQHTTGTWTLRYNRQNHSHLTNTRCKLYTVADRRTKGNNGGGPREGSRSLKYSPSFYASFQVTLSNPVFWVLASFALLHDIRIQRR